MPLTKEEEEERENILDDSDNQGDDENTTTSRIVDVDDLSDSSDDDGFDLMQGRKLEFEKYQSVKTLNFSQLKIDPDEQINKVNNIINKILEYDYIRQYLEDEEIRTGKIRTQVKSEFVNKIKILLSNNSGIISNDLTDNEEVMDNLSYSIFELIRKNKYNKRNNLSSVVFYNYLVMKENEINSINERLQKEIEYREELYPTFVRRYEHLNKMLNTKELNKKQLKYVVNEINKLRKEINDINENIEQKKEEARTEKIDILKKVMSEVSKCGRNSSFPSEVIGIINRDLDDKNGFQNSTKKMDSFSKMKSVFESNELTKQYSTGESYNIEYFINLLRPLVVDKDLGLIGKKFSKKTLSINDVEKIVSNLARCGCLSINGTFAMPQSMAHLGMVLKKEERENLELVFKSANERQNYKLKSSKVHKNELREFYEDTKLFLLKTREQKHYEIDFSKYPTLFNINNRYDINKNLNSLKFENIKKFPKKEQEKFIELINQGLIKGTFMFMYKDGKLVLMNGFEREMSKNSQTSNNVDNENEEENTINLGTNSNGFNHMNKEENRRSKTKNTSKKDFSMLLES